MIGIANISGGKFDKLTIEASSGSVSIRKNEQISVVLCKIHFEAGPTGQHLVMKVKYLSSQDSRSKTRLQLTEYSSGIVDFFSIS
jgi:hypothetical protein